jgi:hypothetical protein
MSWVLYALLERFFYFGPLWVDRTTTGQDFVCENLFIDAQTPTQVPSDWLIKSPLSCNFASVGPQFYIQPSNAGDAKPTLSANYLVGFVRRYINMLLAVEYHSAEYGDILYTHLDHIELTMNGEEYRKWDLLPALQSLDPQYTNGTTSRAQRREAFLDWRPRAMALRKKCGLPWAGVDGWDGSELEDMSYAACLHET